MGNVKGKAQQHYHSAAHGGGFSCLYWGYDTVVVAVMELHVRAEKDMR